MMMQRNDGIDFLRGLSIIFVVLNHCYIHMPFDKTILPKPLFNFLFFSGYYSVILFFVISGFLITSISIKRWSTLAKLSWRSFYFLRFARIMPCLLALLLILSVLHIYAVPGFTIHNTSLPRALFAALTFHLKMNRWIRTYDWGRRFEKVPIGELKYHQK